MAGSDPYFSQVSSLLHFDGANGSTSFSDQKGIVWTPHGSAQLSTTRAKFGPSSASFSPTGSYLSTPHNAALTLNGGVDFTLEAWVYPTASDAAHRTIFSKDYVAGSSYWSYMFALYSGKVRLSTCTGTGLSTLQTVDSAGSVTLNNWNFICAQRRGSNYEVYLGGVVTTQAVSVAIGDGGKPITSGSAGSSGSEFQGYIDEARITKGIARYTGNFTPPAIPFADGQTQIFGNVKFGAAPESRSIKIFDFGSNTLVGTATSDPSTGDYSADVSTLNPVYGVAYNDYGQPWVADSAYAADDRAWPYAAPNGHWYLCTQAGTSDSTEPTWPTDGTTVTDGTAIWTDQGLMERPWIEGPYLPS